MKSFGVDAEWIPGEERCHWGETTAMKPRRCFLTTIAVLALIILLVAMAAASGSSAQAAADALLIDTDTNVAFESISGEAIGALDVGTSPEGNAWFRAAAALQFARGFVNPESAKNLLSEMLSEAVCLHRRAGMSGTGTDVLSASIVVQACRGRVPPRSQTPTACWRWKRLRRWTLG